jgi:hypothetical protein
VRFSALAGESAFRPGRNSAHVFVLSGPPSRPRLEPVKTTLSS